MGPAPRRDGPDDDLRSRTDALFGLPGPEFVAARDALARELPREQRAAVKALRRPSKVAAEMNAAIRRGDPSDLVAAGDAARDGDARAARRVRAAAEALADGAPDVVWADVARALRTAALDPAAREDLLAGTFQAEPRSSGFDLLLGGDAPAPADPPAERRRAGSKARRPRRARGRDESDAGADEAAAAEREAEHRDAARREAEERKAAKRAAAAREKAVAAAEAGVQAAETELTARREGHAAAVERAEAAIAEAAEAEQAADAAGAALDAAREALRDARAEE